jgi:hypothetical protein
MEFVFENVAPQAPEIPLITPPSFAEVEGPLFFILPEFTSRLFEGVTPALILLLLPIFFILRNLIRLVLFVSILARRIGRAFKAKLIEWWMETFEDYSLPLNHKCPACGHRKEHKIHYMREYKRIMHQCAVCSAVFATPCVLDVAKWDVVPIQEAEQQSKAPWMV